MKIDINKDFEKAFPDDLWKGFTLKQIITFAIGIIMAAGTIAVHENLTDHRQLYRHSCDAPDMFFWYL